MPPIDNYADAAQTQGADRPGLAQEIFAPPAAKTYDTANGGTLGAERDADDGNSPGGTSNGLSGLLTEWQEARHLPRRENQPKFESPLVSESFQQGSAELSKEHPSPLTLAAAFDALRRDVGVDLTKPGTWNPDPNNPEQMYMTDRLPGAVESLSSLPSGVEVNGKAAKGDVEPVNQFLKQQGFDIELKSEDDPRALYLAGTLEVKDDWEAKAKKMVANDGKSYDSVYKDGLVYNVDGQDVVQIHDNEDKGIKVYAIPMPEDLPGYEVNRRAEEIIGKLQTAQGTESKVEFPMVDMNSQSQISGIIGMGVKNSDLEITQAVMQNIVKMDETGFQAKQAAAIAILERSIPRPDPAAFQVKDKFIFAVATSDGKFVFASQIGQENWKRPAKVN